MESYNSFKVARQQVLEAAKLLNLDEASKEFLSRPQLEVNFTLPVKMDTGETKIFQAFRVYASLRNLLSPKVIIGST